jgi:hypothetical protein
MATSVGVCDARRRKPRPLLPFKIGKAPDFASARLAHEFASPIGSHVLLKWAAAPRSEINFIFGNSKANTYPFTEIPRFRKSEQSDIAPFDPKTFGEHMGPRAHSLTAARRPLAPVEFVDRAVLTAPFSAPI